MHHPLIIHNVAITLRVMCHPIQHSANDGYNVVITLRVMHHPIHHSKNDAYERLLIPKRIKQTKLRCKGIIATLIAR